MIIRTAFTSRRIILLIFSIVGIQYALNAEPALSDVRAKYELGIKDEHKAKLLLNTIENAKIQSATLLAYRGAAKALIAKHSINPYTKLNYIRASMNDFAEAVELDSKNVEIRYLRFSVQHHLPSFLNLSFEMQEDIKHISDNVHSCSSLKSDKDLKKTIISFMIKSERLRDEELKQLLKEE
jgi:hypothetical protein